MNCLQHLKMWICLFLHHLNTKMRKQWFYIMLQDAHSVRISYVKLTSLVLNVYPVWHMKVIWNRLHGDRLLSYTVCLKVPSVLCVERRSLIEESKKVVAFSDPVWWIAFIWVPGRGNHPHMLWLVVVSHHSSGACDHEASQSLHIEE